jgi:hypothetical protein
MASSLNRIRIACQRIGTSWSKLKRGIQTKGGPKKTEAEAQPSKETATATHMSKSSVQVVTEQDAKKRKELIADWDEIYVGVSMMLSVSKYLELSC